MNDIDGVFIGEVRYFAGDFVPAGFLECNGQFLSVENSDFIPLFSLLQYKYGGAENRNFGLPNIKPKDANGLKAIIAYRGQYPPRS